MAVYRSPAVVESQGVSVSSRLGRKVLGGVGEQQAQLWSAR